MTDVNIRPETVKLLEKIGQHLGDSAGKDMFAYDTESTGRERKKNETPKKRKLKSFCTRKETKNEKATYVMGETKTVCKPYI